MKADGGVFVGVWDGGGPGGVFMMATMNVVNE